MAVLALKKAKCSVCRKPVARHEAVSCDGRDGRKRHGMCAELMHPACAEHHGEDTDYCPRHRARVAA